MPAQFDIPVPAIATTFGAAVDVSAQAPLLTLLSFLDPSTVVVLQESYDGGATWSALLNINGPGVFVLECEGDHVRAGLISGTGGGNLQAAGQNQAGAPTVQNLAVPAGSGPTPVLDISAQPPNLRLNLQTADAQPSTIELSFDAVNFAQLGNITPGVSTPIIAGANKLRLDRRNFGGLAGNLQVAGVPLKSA
jgi:hypothetical protein